MVARRRRPPRAMAASAGSLGRPTGEPALSNCPHAVNALITDRAAHCESARWRRHMRRFYRLTSRSLPARRPGRVPEMASNHWVTASVLIVAATVACVTPRLMSSGAGGEAADRVADASPVEAALTAASEQGAAGGVVAEAGAPLFMPRADPNAAEGFTRLAVQDGPPATAPVPPQATRTPGAESD